MSHSSLLPLLRSPHICLDGKCLEGIWPHIRLRRARTIKTTIWAASWKCLVIFQVTGDPLGQWRQQSKKPSRRIDTPIFDKTKDKLK